MFFSYDEKSPRRVRSHSGEFVVANRVRTTCRGSNQKLLRNLISRGDFDK